jgi:hypothetical protein
MVRKLSGFTFQELNLSIDDIKQTSARGPDLSYDFVNRPAYVHALATADTEFLRLTLNLTLRMDLQPVRLVHGLQNHDEMTYELVHFAGPHEDDLFPFRGAEIRGGDLAITVRRELIERLTGEAGSYNRIFTTNGIACTMATIIAAALGYRDTASTPAPRSTCRPPTTPAVLAMVHRLATGLLQGHRPQLRRPARNRSGGLPAFARQSRGDRHVHRRGHHRDRRRPHVHRHAGASSGQVTARHTMTGVVRCPLGSWWPVNSRDVVLLVDQMPAAGDDLIAQARPTVWTVARHPPLRHAERPDAGIRPRRQARWP